MKKILITVVLSVFIVISLAACCTPSATLDDIEWFLRSYGEQNNLQDIIEGTEITATFDSSEGEVSGSAGCNTYFAGYEVRGGISSFAFLHPVLYLRKESFKEDFI